MCICVLGGLACHGTLMDLREQPLDIGSPLPVMKHQRSNETPSVRINLSGLLFIFHLHGSEFPKVNSDKADLCVRPIDDSKLVGLH